MADSPIDLAGFFGFGSISKKILADTEGFFGWSAARNTNLIVRLELPEYTAAVRQPLQLVMSWPDGGKTLDYDPAFDIQATLPTDTPITLTLVSPWYEPLTTSFSIALGTVSTVRIPLTFAGAYALVTRHHFR